MGLSSFMVTLPLGLMFLFSGFSINMLQVLSLAFLPFSRYAYRIVNMWLMNILWSELVWLLDWWANVKVKFYVDEESRKYVGKEHALLICNHRSDIDWLVGWVLAQRTGCLGGTRAIMKKSAKYLPVIGWSMYFSEYVFLSRTWAKDETTLKAGFLSLKGFPRPFWLALFVEGTRFTKAKLAAAQEYAASVGMRIPQNVLIPRTKGFVSAVANLRSFVPALYDMTVAVSKELPEPTMSRILQGQPSVIHLHLKRVPLKDFPETDESVANWCREAFIRKDEMLDRHNIENSFGEELYVPIPRPYFPLIVVLTWSSLLLTLSSYLLRNVLSSWKGILLISTGLSAVMLLLEVLVRSSEAERSNPAHLLSRTQSQPSSTLTEKKQN